MPEIGAADYLVQILSEIGEAKLSGDHITAIDWPDIQAWSDVTGANLTPGESITIKGLSSVYVAQYYDSLDPSCASPNIERLKDREVIAGKIKSLFSMLRK